ncbi:MAG: type I secretion system permease/ATPase [Sphingobacteriia bacterium]|nr:type I secretion system permease/ATPase [Sphingobacteriia bacterium]
MNPSQPKNNDKDSNNLLVILTQKAKVALSFCLLFGFVSNLLMLALPIYSLQVLDRVISSGSYDTLLMLTLVVGSSVLAMVMLNSARTVTLRGVANWLDQQLSKEIFTRAIHFTISNRGASTSIFFRELENLKNFISGNGLTILIDAPWAIIFVIILFVIHPVNGFLTVFGAFVLIGLALYSERTTKQLFDSANENFNRSMMQMDIVSRNSEIVTAMGMMENIYKYWHNRTNKGQNLKELAADRANFLGNITKFMRYLIQIAVTGLGAFLVLKGEMTTGGMIAGSILVGRALAPFESIVASWKNVILTRKSYEKLKNFLAVNPFIGQSINLPEPTGKIDVTNLVYSPSPNHRPIIKNVSFSLNQGDVLAIIGESAAGKSTLARLLVGVLPPLQGNVMLDGIDIFKWNHAPGEFSCGKYIGYLPQDIELFNGSIKTNIARMEAQPDDDLVIQAAQMAEVHDMIVKMPEGYNTKIGFEGTSLSGGQKQRVGLARSFYGNPKLLVLDEPNANLDQSGEAALFKAVQKVKEKGITTILISHRYSILQAVDKILILKEGQVVDFGERDKILEKIVVKNG